VLGVTTSQDGAGQYPPEGATPLGPPGERVPLRTIAREWGRIGCIGFGGPPAHIALLRKLCVQQRGWLSASEFEDGIAATSLLPGPASTQLAIFCAWRIGGVAGALIGGACFIVPGLIVILALSALFLAHSPPRWITGAAAGAGAAVPAVAISAAVALVPASWRRAINGKTAERGDARVPWSWPRTRWLCYLVAGGVAAALAGEFVVVVLLGCGLAELLMRTGRGRPDGSAADDLTASVRASADRAAGRGEVQRGLLLPVLATGAAAAGGLLAVAWVAFKVGALSFGGGFVIIPLMQHDAVHTYHWMTGAQFLSAVALGQVTPGPVVQTVAVVGYAAAGVGGGLLACLVAFTPSFIFVLVGGPRFDAIRASRTAQAFMTGAGPAAIGAIAGASVTLGLELTQWWQVGLLAAAACWLVLLRRNVVFAIVAAAVVGSLLGVAGVQV
jgi:chromate transporter